MIKNCLRFYLPFLMVLILALQTFNSCKHEPVLLEGLDTVCFNSQILPVLQASCGMTGCHDGSTEGFLATDYQTIVQSVNPYDPRGSKLYQVITDINSDEMMPPDRPLSKNVRMLIHIWISQGAMNTSCEDTSNPTIIDTSHSAVNYDTVCFKQDILPVFISKCSKCHNFTSYQGIMAEGIAEIFEAIVSDEPEDKMPPPNQNPPNTPVSAEEIALLNKWIDQGAIDCDYPQKTCDTSGTITYTNPISSIIQANCMGCHNSSSQWDLSSYGGLKLYADSLKSSIPILLGDIKQINGFNFMPKGQSKLDPCTIRKVEKWIETGEPE